MSDVSVPPKALVTGATGFVGSYLVRELVKKGCKTTIFCRETQLPESLQDLSLNIAQGDINDLGSLKKAVQGVDVVFHLAGLIAHTRSQRDSMMKINVQGTQSVVTACSDQKVALLVHMSSVAAVGASFTPSQAMNETSEFNLSALKMAYPESKKAAEEIVFSAVRAGKLRAIALCPGTIYGAGDALKATRNTQLKVAKGKLPFYTSGGVNVVDVESVVRSTIAASSCGRSGERYLLGGENVLIRDLFSLIALEARVSAPSIYLPNALVLALGKLGDLLEKRGKHGPLNSENAWNAILFHWFDSAKAKIELGHHPASPVQAVRASIEWSRKHRLL